MAQTKEGARKARERILARDPGFYGRIGSMKGHGGLGGFGSDKIGKDGLTGKQRAVQAGKKGGKASKRG